MCRMDLILRDAHTRRDAALAEADKWSQFIRLYDELRGGSRGAMAGHIKIMSGVSSAALTSAINNRQPRKMQETEAAAVAVIRDFGKPVPGRELLAEILKRGVNVGGKDPYATLMARLGRATALEFERPYGWRVKNDPGQKDEAAAPRSESEAAASGTPNDAVRRGEVEHQDIT